MSTQQNEQVNNEQQVMSLEDDNQPTYITLTTKDGGSQRVNKAYACISKVLATTLESDPTATEVPLNEPEINASILADVAAYIEHHKGTEPAIVEKPLRSKLMKEVTTAWCAEFIDRIGEDRKKLYAMISCANYLDIQSLLHLGCAKVASLIKGQPLDKIKEILTKNLQEQQATTA